MNKVEELKIRKIGDLRFGNLQFGSKKRPTFAQRQKMNGFGEKIKLERDLQITLIRV